VSDASTRRSNTAIEHKAIDYKAIPNTRCTLTLTVTLALITRTLTRTRTRTRTRTPTLTLTLTLTLTPDPNPNLIKLEQVSLHEDRLLLEALLQLIGKAHLQPYAVAATVAPPPPTWARGSCRPTRRRALSRVRSTIPCTTMLTDAAAAAFIAACSGSSVCTLARCTCTGGSWVTYMPRLTTGRQLVCVGSDRAGAVS